MTKEIKVSDFNAPVRTNDPWSKYEDERILEYVDFCHANGKGVGKIWEKLAKEFKRTTGAVKNRYYNTLKPMRDHEKFIQHPENTAKLKKQNVENDGGLHTMLTLDVHENRSWGIEKAIIIDEQAIIMNFEDVLKQFNPMLRKQANLTLSKIVYNKPEYEEVMQELKLQAWEAFDRYDGRGAFSTYLHYYLLNGANRSTQKLYAQKRTNTNGSISMSEVVGGGEGDENEIGNFLGELDQSIESLIFVEFVEKLEKMLDSVENKILQVLMSREDFTVQDLANELGMSRQGANKKVNKFKEKLAEILLETGYHSMGA